MGENPKENGGEKEGNPLKTSLNSGLGMMVICLLGCPRKLVNGYNLPINGVYWGYSPLTNLLLTSWDIQVEYLDIPKKNNFGFAPVCWKQLREINVLN